MRIAIVGSGIAGLTAAWRLGLDHEVEIFEAQPVLGMDAASVSVDAGGREARIDVPLRVFGSGYYPNLVRLYAEAGIPRGRADYSASYSRLDGPTYFAYRSFEVDDRAVSLPDLRLGRPKDNLRRLRHGARLYLSEGRRLRAHQIPDETIERYLARRGYPPEFTDDVLMPTLAAILTCSQDDARGYSARSVLDFFSRSFGSSFGRVSSGTRAVVERLSTRASKVHLGAPVRGLRRRDGAVELTDEAGHTHGFDHAILATQAHRARQLLDDLRDDERAVFEAFGTTRFECVVHRDPRLMPEDRRGWRPINALVVDRNRMPMFTMWMNGIIRELRDAPPLFQTINPLREPRPELAIHRIRLDRPVLSVGSQAACRRLAGLHAEPGRRVWFCGSYATEGFPLLESAAVSATDVAQRIRRADRPT